MPHPAPSEAVDALIAAAQVADAKRDVAGDAPEGNRQRAELRRLRNEALIRALYSSGMRIGEALALVRGDLDSVQHSARVVGKNNKERIVYFSEDAWTALTVYLGEREGLNAFNPYRARAEEPVFAQHYRGAGKRLTRLTRQRVEQMFAEWRQLSGIEEHVTPHRLRHGFAVKMLRKTHNLVAVQDLMGHASANTTRVYTPLDDESLREAHRSAWKDEG